MADDPQPRQHRTSQIIAIAVWLLAVSTAYYAGLWKSVAPLTRLFRGF